VLRYHGDTSSPGLVRRSIQAPSQRQAFAFASLVSSKHVGSFVPRLIPSAP